MYEVTFNFLAYLHLQLRAEMRILQKKNCKRNQRILGCQPRAPSSIKKTNLHVEWLWCVHTISFVKYFDEQVNENVSNQSG